MELPNDGTNELSKYGFDEIALKVIFQGRKGQICPFSHKYLCYSVIPKCWSILSCHVASLNWSQYCPKIWMLCSHSKWHFQGRKVKYGPLWFICTNISETVYVRTKVYMQHKYVIYALSVDILMTFKCIIKVIEFLVSCIFWMVHVMTKIYMKHIQ